MKNTEERFMTNFEAMCQSSYQIYEDVIIKTQESILACPQNELKIMA